jgi:hypothetical protein
MWRRGVGPMAEDEGSAEREDCVEEKLACNDRVAGEEGIESGGLTRGERSLIRRFSEVLRFADFMAVLMVAATAFSAFATWRTAQVTNLLFSIAERPYIGIQRTTFDSIGADAARLTIDFRNFGQVSATDGVATIRLLVDGTPLERGTAATINVGMVSPTVPHLYSSYVPADIYQKILNGKARLVVQTSITYRGPDGRQFCYHESNTYDHRTNAFGPSGGSDKCGDAIY